MKRFFYFLSITFIMISGLLLFNCQQPVVSDTAQLINNQTNLCEVPKDTFIFIHGAWHGSWCWFQTSAVLRENGYKVITVDLPGHGSDKTPPGLITLDSYVQTVLKVIDNQPGQVILVGHSAGGITISQVAEYRPEKIKGLVYLSAYLVRNGETLLSIAEQDTNSVALQHLIVNENEGYIDIDRNYIRKAFYDRCEEKYYILAKILFTLEPIQPLLTPLNLAENYNSVKKYYIRTLYDNAVTFEAQNKMLADTPVNKIFTLETDHSSFFSLNGRLVEKLIKISKILNNSDLNNDD
jgi:pimeloyl-ACP methyl ester carboxylesterase